MQQEERKKGKNGYEYGLSSSHTCVKISPIKPIIMYNKNIPIKMKDTFELCIHLEKRGRTGNNLKDERQLVLHMERG